MDNDQQGTDEKANADAEQAVLAELRGFLQDSISAEGDQRLQGETDVEFLVAIDQWPADIKAQRQFQKRPALTVNTLPSMVQQVTNEQRQNTPAIKVHPVSDGADKKVARIVQGVVRHSEYVSNADSAYDCAVNWAAAIGFGYFRLVTRYEDPKSFNQVIRFGRIRNPFAVYFDPYSVEPDGSDARKAAISDTLSEAEWKSQYPNEPIPQWSDFAAGLGDSAPFWQVNKGVRVVEYYRIAEKARKLALLADGSTAWKDEVPDGVAIVDERDSCERVVEWRKCCAWKCLEMTIIPGEYIPVLPVYGAEWIVHGKVHRSGLVRYARDSATMYNFWITSATEQVALVPKAPYVAAEGQIEGYESEWENANNSAVSVLTYKPTTIDNLLVPPPQRQPMADIPAGMITMSMHARDNIKATMGIFDASLGAQGNETSGRAINARKAQSSNGSYHFTDNLEKAVRHAGQIFVGMMPAVYDTERVVAIMGENEKMSSVRINQPQQQAQTGPGGYGEIVTKVLNDVRVGKYDITISAGPAYSTQLQEATDAMVGIAQSWPKFMDIAGDKVVKAMAFPGSDGIAARIEASIPAELRAAEQAEDDEQLSPTARAMLEKADQTVKMMDQQIEQLTAIVQKQQQELSDQDKDRKAQLAEATIKARTELQKSRDDVEKARIEAASGAMSADINARVESLTASVEALAGIVEVLIGDEHDDSAT